MLPQQQVNAVSWVFLHPMQDPGGQPTEWKLFTSISLFDQQGEPGPVYDAWLSFQP